MDLPLVPQHDPHMEPRPHKTRRAWNDPGHAHFLTYSCFQRLPLLTRIRSRRWVIAALEATRRKHDVALYAYVIMPEHVHVVLEPRQTDYQMRRILATLKRPVSDAARDYLTGMGRSRWLARLTVSYPSRTVFRFWQPGGGFDHNLFREKTLRTVIDYVHKNPVRRELCATATDWTWSSAGYWEGMTDAVLRMDQPAI